ncbi:hypothetical protein D3C78_1700660 [compost metagenome]
MGEGVTLLTAGAPAEATGFQHMGAQSLIHGHGELAALPLNGRKPCQGRPAEGVLHAHRVEADSQLPLVARTGLQVEQVATRRQQADQQLCLDLEIVDQQHLG